MSNAEPGSESLWVAVAQLNSTPDMKANLRAMEHYAAEAASAGCAVLMVPECAPQMRPDSERLHEAEPMDGAQIRACQDLCRRYNLGMLIGSFAQQLAGDNARFTNTSVFLGRDGSILGDYQKVHLFEAYGDTGHVYDEARYVEAGKPIPVVVEFEDWRFGLSICYDLRFPGLYRQLVDAGADVLCVPAAFTYETGAAHWELLLRARAVENTRYVIAPAQTGINYPNRRTWGHSMVVGPWGDVLAQIGTDSGLIIHRLERRQITRAEARNPSLANRRYTAIARDQG